MRRKRKKKAAHNIDAAIGETNKAIEALNAEI
jgi:hypothetical protein